MAKTFPLGVVVVEVTTRDGRTTVEDWAPKDAKAAREYAAETACCTDVACTTFRDNRSGKEETYVTQVKEPTEAREASAEGGALSCPKCGAANADDAGDLCIGEDCPVQQSDDFDEALRIYHGTPAPGMVEEPSSKGDGRG